MKIGVGYGAFRGFTPYKDPTKYFTEDIMKQLDAAARKEFMYGEVTPESEINEWSH